MESSVFRGSATHPRAQRRARRTSVLLLAGIGLATIGLTAACGDGGGTGQPSVWRDEVHRPSGVAGLGWELVPEVDLEVEGLRVRTSSIGARDEEPTPGDDVFRVAALGGCFTFGWELEGEASWPRLLERELVGSILVMGRAVDFLDLAVCGWGATQQAAWIEHRVLGLDPWAVVLEHSFEDPAAAHVAELRALAGIGAAPSIAAAHDPEGRPWRELADAWARVQELCTPRNIPVVLIIVPRLDGEPWESYPHRALHEQVAREGRRHGFTVLDLLERFEAEPSRELVRGLDALTASARAHEITADAVKRLLYSSGVLTRILEAH